MVEAPWPQPTSATLAPPLVERLDGAGQRRQPLVDQRGGVPRPEEPLGAAEQAGVVLVPAEAPPVPERLGDRGLALGRGEHDLEPADTNAGLVSMVNASRCSGESDHWSTPRSSEPS